MSCWFLRVFLVILGTCISIIELKSISDDDAITRQLVNLLKKELNEKEHEINISNEIHNFKKLQLKSTHRKLNKESLHENDVKDLPPFAISLNNLKTGSLKKDAKNKKTVKSDQPNPYDSFRKIVKKRKPSEKKTSANKYKKFINSQQRKTFDDTALAHCRGNVTNLINNDVQGFESEGYPIEYPIDLDVCWQVGYSSQTYYLSFETPFNVEGSPGLCYYDYINIYYPGSDQPAFPTLCGSDKPEVIELTSEALVHFHSDESVMLEGFKASITLEVPIVNENTTEIVTEEELVEEEEEICNGQYEVLAETTTQVFSTTGFPDQTYGINVDFCWIIGYEGLETYIIFDPVFEIEDDAGVCNYDYVSIYKPEDVEPSYGPFCGSTAPSPIRLEGYGLVHFHSDESFGRNGFKINVTREVPVDLPPENSIEEPEDEEDICQGNVIDLSGDEHQVFQSRNYPYPYEDETDMCWVVGIPNEQSFITFNQDFAVEGFSINDCSYDYLNIYYPNSEEADFGPLCGQETPDVITLQGVALVHFHSDASVEWLGFEAVVSRENQSDSSDPLRTTLCQGVISVLVDSGTQVFSTENYPGEYPINDEKCWKVGFHDQQSQLVFSSPFSLEEATSGLCSYDFVEIYYSGSSEPVFGPFCGTSKPDDIILEGEAYVRFKSDYSVSKEGFEATVQIPQDQNTGTHECIDKIDFIGENDVTINPVRNEQSTYADDLRTCWFIGKQNEESTITFNPDNFDIEDATDCTYDSLSIYDRQSGALLHGPFCGMFAPEPITIQGEAVLFFSTDQSEGRIGFIAHVQFGNVDEDCEVVDGANSITSQGYSAGNSYPHDTEHCWIIGDNTQGVELSIIDFYVEDSSGCQFDYVHISTVLDGKKVIEDTLCGQIEERTFHFPTGPVYIDFKSDDSVSKPGFKIDFVVGESNANALCQSFNSTIGEFSLTPQDYINNADLCWTITAPPGDVIEVTFSTLDIQGTYPDCLHDKLTITDDAGMQVILCGYKHQEVFSSTSGLVKLEFTSDSTETFSGFTATYQIHNIAQGCFEISNIETEMITSHNYPNGYQANTAECLTFRPPSGLPVRLSFLDFELQLTFLCDMDYLDVYDGELSTGILIGRYCDLPPTDIIAPSGIMTLDFRSNEDDVIGKGFKARLTTEPDENDEEEEENNGGENENGGNSNESDGNSNVDDGTAVTVPIKDNGNGGDNENIIIGEDNSNNNGINSGGDSKPSNNTDSINVENSSSSHNQPPRQDNNACSGTPVKLEGSQGTIHFFGTGDYDPNLKCEWIITVPDGARIKIYFDEFELEGGRQCPYDAVAMLEEGRVHHKSCGSHNYDMYSRANVVTLKFYSDKSNGGRGFVAHYEARSDDIVEIENPPCGIVSQTRPHSRIVGGTEALPYDWPWQILLTYKGQRSCGGSILSNRYILTAAHCVVDDLTPEHYSVVVGQHDRSVFAGIEESHSVKTINSHVGYTDLEKNNDIAILELIRPIRFMQHIKPVCLSTKEPDVGANVWVTGWGETQNFEEGDLVLREVDIQIYENDPNWFNGKLTPEMLWAGTESGGKDTCQGDSGGPLVFQETLNGPWIQAGITSFGVGCGVQDHHGVYARVTKFMEWINNATDSTAQII